MKKNLAMLATLLTLPAVVLADFSSELVD